ncbi:transposase [Cucumis melo var. makuwa]|uniref:Transposase n=1 Tax=Cucumis melo var. makuwa TaxID=1194695 RepID=A0A5D3BHJ9_CUCMM|nr:transposase [Cucumis melo var. makuwa]
MREIQEGQVVSRTIRWIAHGPSSREQVVMIYEGYNVNGICYNTKPCDDNKMVQNSGVMFVASTMHVASVKDKNPIIANMSFYGVIQGIWEERYNSFMVTQLRCDWIDTKNGVRVDDLGFTLVDLNCIGHYSNSFILASQARQNELGDTSLNCPTILECPTDMTKEDEEIPYVRVDCEGTWGTFNSKLEDQIFNFDVHTSISVSVVVVRLRLHRRTLQLHHLRLRRRNLTAPAVAAASISDLLSVLSNYGSAGRLCLYYKQHLLLRVPSGATHKVQGIKELTFKFSGSAAGLLGDSFPFLGVDSIEGHNRVSGKGSSTTRPRSEAGNVVVHRGLHVRAQRGADRREAGRTREGHMDASGFLIASAMYFWTITYQTMTLGKQARLEVGCSSVLSTMGVVNKGKGTRGPTRMFEITWVSCSGHKRVVEYNELD